MHVGISKCRLFVCSWIFFLLATIGDMRCLAADTPIAAADHNALIGRCINLNEHLGNSQLQWAEAADYQRMVDVGFTSVRISVSFSDHASWTAPFTLNEDWMLKVDAALNNALAVGLVPILDFHGYGAHLETDTYSTWHRDRFVTLWQLIADRYKNADPRIAFEILNEPHGNLTSDVWNGIIPLAINAIRGTGQNNTARNIIVDSVNWSSYSTVSSLQLPAGDSHLIVSFHYYEPMGFTHQGASWVTGSDAWLGTQFTATDVANVQTRFSQLHTWAQTNARPIFVGEFGAINFADPLSRVIFAITVRAQAEYYGFSHAWWGMHSSSFGIFNDSTNLWDRSIINALTAEKPEFWLENQWAQGMYLKTPYTTTSDTSVVTADTTDNANKFIWQFAYISDRKFNLRNKHTGMYLNSVGNTSGSSVAIAGYHSDWGSMKWDFTYNSADDTYGIKDNWGYLNLNATTTSAGAAVKVNGYNSSWTSEKWLVTPVWR